MPEPLADATVEVIEDATSPLVTRDYLDARLARALFVLAGFIVAVAGASLAAAQVLG